MNKAMKSDNIMNLSSENYQNNGYIIKWVIKQIIIAYLIFLLLLLAIIVYNNSIQENKLSFNECLLLLRSFIIFELLFHKETLYALLNDPFELLVLQILFAPYYIAYIIYLDLKIKYHYKTDIFYIKNISPFVLSFGWVLTPIAFIIVFFVVFTDAPLHIWLPYLLYVIFGAFGLLSHRVATNKLDKILLNRVAVAVFVLNIIGFTLWANWIISKAFLRFGFH